VVHVVRDHHAAIRGDVEVLGTVEAGLQGWPIEMSRLPVASDRFDPPVPHATQSVPTSLQQVEIPVVCLGRGPGVDQRRLPGRRSIDRHAPLAVAHQACQRAGG